MEIMRFLASLFFAGLLTVVGVIAVSSINCDSNNANASQACNSTKNSFYAIIAVVDIFALIEGTTGAISAGMNAVRAS